MHHCSGHMHQKMLYLIKPGKYTVHRFKMLCAIMSLSFICLSISFHRVQHFKDLRCIIIIVTVSLHLSLFSCIFFLPSALCHTLVSRDGSKIHRGLIGHPMSSGRGRTLTTVADRHKEASPAKSPVIT